MDAVGVAIVAVLLGLLVVWLVALADAIRTPEWRWHSARRSKPAWVIGLVLCRWVAGLVYLASVRPLLTRARNVSPTPQPARVKVPRRRDWGDPWKDG